MLLPHLQKDRLEAGCDEAGRGCLAGPVFAAAVLLPADFEHPDLNDSKKLSLKQRNDLRNIIEKEAISWAVAPVPPAAIDELNILWASVKAMHLAIEKLKVKPEFLLIDGNRFRPYPGISHLCIIKGDGKYQSIAAASVLAKTHRDEFMQQMAAQYPQYGWERNKGYPTKEHRRAIQQYGETPEHRKSFKLIPDSLQGKLFT